MDEKIKIVTIEYIVERERERERDETVLICRLRLQEIRCLEL